jgi:ribosomal protein S18 acetylase RimI-like enzyme
MADRIEFDIRPAQADDRAALLDLSGRLTIGAAPWRDPDRIAAVARGWVTGSLESAGQEGHAMLVALLDGQVVGLVSVAELDHFTGETEAYIGELAVAAAVEGRGAGRALLAAAERWAASRGLTHLTLHTGWRNHRARQFYERAGFLAEDIRFTKPALAASG